MSEDNQFADNLSILASKLLSGNMMLIDTEDYLELMATRDKKNYVNLTIETTDYIDENGEVTLTMSGVSDLSYDIDNNNENLDKFENQLTKAFRDQSLYKHMKDEYIKMKSELSHSEYMRDSYRDQNKDFRQKIEKLEAMKLPFYKRIFKKSEKA